MNTKTLLFLSLAGVILLMGGMATSAQDATNAAAAPAAADTGDNLGMFSGPHWHINLGTEFPGAQGTFTIVDQDSAKAGKLTYDFTAGGLYVAGVGEVSIPDGYTEFHVQVKSATAQKIVIRLIDSTKQCHQFPLPYTDAGNWQTLRVDLKDPSAISFNGAKDHIVHFPVSEIWLGLEKSASQPQGETFFKDGIVLK